MIRTTPNALARVIVIIVLGVTLVMLTLGRAFPAFTLNLELIGLLKRDQNNALLKQRLFDLCQTPDEAMNPRHAWWTGWLAINQLDDPVLALCLWRKAPDYSTRALSRAVESRLGQPISLEYARLVVKMAPDAFVARWAYARALFRLQYWSEASNALDLVLEMKPDHAEANALKGYAVLKANGPIQNVRHLLEYAFRLDSKNDWAIRYLFYFYYDHGTPTELESITKYALTRRPDDFDYNTGMGDILLKRGDYDASEKYYLVALNARPNSSFIRIKTGDLYRARGNLTLALEYYASAIEASPDEDWLYLRLAEAYLLAGDRGQAVKVICSAMELGVGMTQMKQKLDAIQASCDPR